jgi:hypothetical protein
MEMDYGDVVMLIAADCCCSTLLYMGRSKSVTAGTYGFESPLPQDNR